MNLNRRDILRGFVAGAAGLLVPSGVVDAAKEGRRWWALDRRMTSNPVYASYHVNRQLPFNEIQLSGMIGRNHVSTFVAHGWHYTDPDILVREARRIAVDEYGAHRLIVGKHTVWLA